MVGGREAGDVADLGHEHRGEDRADPGDGLDGPVAGVVGQGGLDALLGHLDLAFDDLHHVAEGLDPDGVGVAEGASVEQGGPSGAEQVAHRDRHPLLGQHRMHLRLEAGAQVDQFRPMADQLT
jgi:hypothetical protein